MSPEAAPDSPLARVLGLHQRCLRAQDVAELGFVIANETWHVLPYRQASVFVADGLGQLALQTVSGLASVNEDTPFGLWLGRVCGALTSAPTSVPSADDRRPTSADFPASPNPAAPRRLAAAMFDAELADGWSEWWPEHAVAVPLIGKAGRRQGMVFLVRDEPWSDGELELLALMAQTWSHCLKALLRDRIDWRAFGQRLLASRQRRWIAFGLLVLAAFPVRLSALAPAEIIPLQAQVLAAPMEGVIKTFHVPPNAAVKAGDKIFSLDDTSLRNRRDVARESLAVARADALAAQQKAFDSLQSKSELGTLRGHVLEKEAELAFIEENLTRIDVLAPHDGVAVFGDANDWLGKPVVTGERIALLAQPDDLGVLMWLPVGDAINLEAGAAMRVYLQVSPLSSLSAALVQTSYQATLSPEGIAAYRIRGKLAPGSEARIGLRGVAKVYGGWRPLSYWLLRRPLGALRQWLGV